MVLSHRKGKQKNIYLLQCEQSGTGQASHSAEIIHDLCMKVLYPTVTQMNNSTADGINTTFDKYALLNECTFTQ